MLRKTFSTVLVFMSLSLPAFALNLSGIENSHDPAALIKDGNTYFHFTTGAGIWYSRSTNLTTWGNPGTVFPTYSWPSWIYNEVPGFDGHFWAPDVIYMGGYYYLYYSASTFGSSRSAIGVVRSRSLQSPNWQDLGMVVDSNGGGNEVNAIDPALFRDTDGKVYMSYGSFFGGIALSEINPNTGKRTGLTTLIHGGGHQDIEAPYIIKNGNFYYLFVNRGSCCRGSRSSYYIQVGRSLDIRGPYEGWRTVLNNQTGKYKGPGHIGLLKENGCNYVSTHYYDLYDRGNAKLDILSLSFNSSAWPELTRNFTVGNCN